MKHFVIGDVHGNYDALKKLFEKLPSDAIPIFVGDLIDRGDKSKDVVAFVRENAFLCVKGNHEAMMIEYGTEIIKALKENRAIYLYDFWLQNGGFKTLLSYGLFQFIDDIWQKIYNKESLELFENDIKWMQKLPVYIELGIKHNNLPVVISHAQIASVWEYKDIEPLQKHFEYFALWNRKEIPKKSPIFNVFGHTPQAKKVKIEKNFVNVDRGCYKKDTAFKKLAAYCIETQEVIEVSCS